MYGKVTSIFRNEGTLNFPMSEAMPVMACTPVFGAGYPPVPPTLYNPLLKNSGSAGPALPAQRAALVNMMPLWHCEHFNRSPMNSASPRLAPSEIALELPRRYRSYGESPDTNVRSKVAMALVTLPTVKGRESAGKAARNRGGYTGTARRRSSISPSR